MALGGRGGIEETSTKELSKFLPLQLTEMIAGVAIVMPSICRVQARVNTDLHSTQKGEMFIPYWLQIKVVELTNITSRSAFKWSGKSRCITSSSVMPPNFESRLFFFFFLSSLPPASGSGFLFLGIVYRYSAYCGRLRGSLFMYVSDHASYRCPSGSSLVCSKLCLYSWSLELE